MINDKIIKRLNTSPYINNIPRSFFKNPYEALFLVMVPFSTQRNNFQFNKGDVFYAKGLIKWDRDKMISVISQCNRIQTISVYSEKIDCNTLIHVWEIDNYIKILSYEDFLMGNH